MVTDAESHSDEDRAARAKRLKREPRRLDSVPGRAAAARRSATASGAQRQSAPGRAVDRRDTRTGEEQLVGRRAAAPAHRRPAAGGSRFGVGGGCWPAYFGRRARRRPAGGDDDVIDAEFKQTEEWSNGTLECWSIGHRVNHHPIIPPLPGYPGDANGSHRARQESSND